MIIFFYNFNFSKTVFNNVFTNFAHRRLSISSSFVTIILLSCFWSADPRLSSGCLSTSSLALLTLSVPALLALAPLLLLRRLFGRLGFLLFLHLQLRFSKLLPEHLLGLIVESLQLRDALTRKLLQRQESLRNVFVGDSIRILIRAYYT